jgi:uncharacterized protein
MTTLHLARDDVRDISIGDRRILFHVPTSGLFEMDAVGGELLDLFAELGAVGEEDIRRRFDGRVDPSVVVETLKELITLRVIDNGLGGPVARKPVEIEEFPLSTVVLNVNTGCNLSCTYCYKEDLTTPAKGERMDFETAARSVDLLFQEAASRDAVNVVFFGGEPLTNMRLIREVVAYAEGKGRECRKRVDFSLTTNAVLLTEDIANWLDEHRFGITVSMDGPKHLHDRNRKTVGGRGSYDVVAAKARMLLGRYQSRPIGARVTLTAGVTDVVAIHEHLKDEIGFFEVGFSPVTSGQAAHFNLSGDELQGVFEGMKVLGLRYLEAARRDENIGFGNMHQLMTDLSEGTTKALPCGAGLGMLAVDKAGDLHLCHRFTGSSHPTYGNVEDGIEKESLSEFLEGMANRTGTECETCWIRKLCAGGCYHESYARYADPAHPTYHYCNLMRDWIDFGIRIYAEIMVSNPGFIERHVAPRRGKK